jgi:hypothetical protein
LAQAPTLVGPAEILIRLLLVGAVTPAASVSSSRVGRRPVRNSLYHLVGAREQHRRHLEAEPAPTAASTRSSNAAPPCRAWARPDIARRIRSIRPGARARAIRATKALPGDMNREDGNLECPSEMIWQ